MVANSELIAVEIVRTLCGSIGLVAAVPITTALAAAVLQPSAAIEIAIATDASDPQDDDTSDDDIAADKTATSNLREPKWADFGPIEDQ